MFVIRDVQRSDLPALQKLARELDTVNLPDDERELLRIIDWSPRPKASDKQAMNAGQQLQLVSFLDQPFEHSLTRTLPSGWGLLVSWPWPRHMHGA